MYFDYLYINEATIEGNYSGSDWTELVTFKSGSNGNPMILINGEWTKDYEGMVDTLLDLTNEHDNLRVCIKDADFDLLSSLENYIGFNYGDKLKKYHQEWIENYLNDYKCCQLEDLWSLDSRIDGEDLFTLFIEDLYFDDEDLFMELGLNEIDDFNYLVD